MKRFSEQFKKQAETIRLRASERRELRQRLAAYLEYHPLPATMRQRPGKKVARRGINSEAFTALPINWFWVRSASAIFAVFLLVVVPAAAEYTTPGDVLYPVKVRFNEEVWGTLSLSPYQKIEWETTRLERRVAEARQLASEGKLTDEIEAQMATAVKNHSEKAQSEIAVLRSTDSEKAAIAEITFASALAVQSEVLQTSVGNNVAVASDTATEANQSGQVLASVVAHESDLAAANQAEATLSYQSLLAYVEKESTRAYELFTSVKKRANSEVQADIERRLADIGRKVTDATNLVATGESNANVDAVTTDTASTAASAAEPVGEVVATTTDTTTTADNGSSFTEIVATTSVEEPALDETSETGAPVSAETEATKLLREALSDLTKLISYMSNITVRETVSIETLVPVSLTNDERRANIMVDLEEVEKFTRTHASSTFRGEKMVKLEKAGSDLAIQIAVVKEALRDNNLDRARKSLELAHSLMENIVAMTETSTTATKPNNLIEKGITTESSISSTTEE